MLLQINTETYFWLVDRLKIADDTKNKVNKVTNLVTLSKPFLKKCENGHYLGMLLREMYATYSNRTGKSFKMTNIVTDIPSDLEPFNQQVWTGLFEVLFQFGIKLEPNKQEILVKTSNTQIVLDIVEALWEIDNSNTGQLGQAMKRKLGIKINHPSANRSIDLSQKVIDFGGNKSDIRSMIDQRSQGFTSPRKSSQLPLKPTGQFEKVTQSARRNSALPRQEFEPPAYDIQRSPVNQLSGRKGLIAQSTIPKASLPAGTTPSRILGKESQLLANVRSDQLEEVMPQNLSDCKTSFQFVILSLMQSFSLKPKQAAALLTDNNKFLTHMTVKGTKGGDFESVKLWYNTLLYNYGILIRLISTEKKDIVSYQTPLMPMTSKVADANENRGKILMKTLNIIKGGFYSLNEDVKYQCGQVFLMIITEINQTYQELQQDAWDWLTTHTVKPEFRRKKQVIPDSNSKLSMGSHLVSFEKNSPSKPQVGDDVIESKDLEAYSLQTGLQAILFSYNKKVESLDVTLTSLELLSFAKIDPTMFFTQTLRTQMQQWHLYSQLCTDIFVSTVGQQLFTEVLEQGGVLKFWVTECFKVADVSNQVTLNDRITSMVLLTEIWLARPNYFDPLQQKSSPENMIQILKKGARDYQRTLCLVSIQLMFRLLDSLAEQKHSLAPIIYKTLAFLLVEFYWEMDIREIMLCNFMKLYANYDIIPINILLEPLLKQIETSQYHDTGFNVFDFDFFSFTAAHRKLTLPTAIQLADCLSKIALSSVAFQVCSTKIIVSLIQRFQGYNEFTQLWEDNFHQVLSTIVNIEARLVIHRYHLRQEENNFFHRLALKNKKDGPQSPGKSSGRMSDQDYIVLKTNERLAVNLIHIVIRQQNYELNEFLRFQLIDTFIAIQRELKVYCHAIAFLLRNYTSKVDQMIEYRSAENPNAGSNIIFPFAEELKQIINTSANPTSQGIVAIYNASSNTQRQHKGKLITVPALGVPQHEPTRVFQVSVALPLNSPEKKKVDQSQLYDLNKWEEEWEIKQYQNFQKKHYRLYKELHRCYTYEYSVKIPHAIARTTFEQHEKSIDQITSASLVKMIKDFRLENGINQTQLKEEVIRLVKQINLYILKQTVDVQTLTFEGFCHFLIQYAYMLWHQEPQNKAYHLIDKLFDHIKDQPQFEKIGLTVNKTETTNRKDVQTLLTLQQIKQQDPDFNLQDYKQVDDVVQTVEHVVPPFFPMKQSKKIVVELLDSILSQCLGVHFLEPVQVETVHKKFVPIIVSRRTVPVPPMIAQKVRGNPSNQPLSHEVVLSAAQIEAKEKYERVKQQKKQKRQSEYQQSSIMNDDQSQKNSDFAITNVETQYYTRKQPGQKPEIIQHRIVKLNVPQLTTDEDFRRATERSSVKMVSQQEQFKAQALNKRASKLGQTMQLSVIQAYPLAQKQLIFECGEVLDEVLKAVEKGKKSLRLDYTPYKLYDLHKERVKRQQQTIKEEDEEPDRDEDVLNYKREAVQNFMSKQVSFLEQQKVSLAEQEELRKKEQMKKENKKRRLVEDYKSVAEATAAEAEKRKQEEAKLKAEKLSQEEAEQRQKQEAMNRRIKESLKQHKQALQLQSEENGLKQQEEEYKQQIASQKQKALAEKMTKLHKEKAAVSKQTKNEAREKFFEFINYSPIQQIINKTYQKSLIVKYDQCMKISQRTSGVTQAGWLDWLIQQGVGTLTDPKLLVILHGSQVKEQESGQDYSCVSQEYLKVAPGPPGDKEISYTGFVIAIIKLANLVKLPLRQQKQNKGADGAQAKPQIQKTKVDDFMEYSIEDFSAKDLQNFLKFLKSL